MRAWTALIAMQLTVSAVAIAAGPPEAQIELETHCVTDSSGLSLRFEVWNTTNREFWIVADTEPWAPSFISNKLQARVHARSADTLPGPLAFGHAVKPTRLVSRGAAGGAISLTQAFPDLASTSVAAPVLITWEWQGLASEAEVPENFSPMTKFEGGITVHEGRCSNVFARRV